jgi:hypothetical protein
MIDYHDQIPVQLIDFIVRLVIVIFLEQTSETDAV